MTKTLLALVAVCAFAAGAVAAPIRARLSTTGNATGPQRYCLTPHARGDVVLPAKHLPRQACLSSAQWALRGVVLR